MGLVWLYTNDWKQMLWAATNVYYFWVMASSKVDCSFYCQMAAPQESQQQLTCCQSDPYIKLKLNQWASSDYTPVIENRCCELPQMSTIFEWWQVEKGIAVFTARWQHLKRHNNLPCCQSDPHIKLKPKQWASSDYTPLIESSCCELLRMSTISECWRVQKWITVFTARWQHLKGHNNQPHFHTDPLIKLKPKYWTLSDDTPVIENSCCELPRMSTISEWWRVQKRITVLLPDGSTWRVTTIPYVVKVTLTNWNWSSGPHLTIYQWLKTDVVSCRRCLLFLSDGEFKSGLQFLPPDGSTSKVTTISHIVKVTLLLNWSQSIEPCLIIHWWLKRSVVSCHGCLQFLSDSKVGCSFCHQESAPQASQQSAASSKSPSH